MWGCSVGVRMGCAVAIAWLGAGPAGAAGLTAFYEFPGHGEGQSPQAKLIDVGGTLYGVAAGGGNWFSGTIFRLDRATGAETTVYSFTGKNDGAAPAGGLIEVGGMLYGTTSAGGASGNGVLFRFDPATLAETTLHSFAGGTQGAHPYSALLNVNGVLYGTTYGSNDGTGGSIFSYDLASATETTLTTQPLFAYAGLIAVGSLLYGTTEDSVFSFDPATRIYTVVYQFTGNLDGGGAFGGLVDVDGTLYGTTRNGGRYGSGVVYAIDPATGAQTTVYSFTGGQDGAWPLASLIAVGGKLYGTASSSGADYSGTIFRVDPRTGKEKTLYAITYQTDGSAPSGAPTDVDGVLYATVSEVGPANEGSVVAVDIATGAATTLHAFVGQNGHVNSGLTKVAGKLYGVASQGGPVDQGIIVRLDPVTGTTTTVYAFQGGQDGASPQGRPLFYKSAFYGTTASGGAQGAGTVYRFTPATGAEVPLYAFTGGADGATPDAGLITIGGTLYGTTQYGGATDNGSVFRLDPGTGTEATVFSFDAFKANYGDLTFDSSLLLAGADTVYGVRYGLAFSTGLVYSVNLSTGAGTVLHSFDNDTGDGYYPHANLITADGALYGTTEQGGKYGYGAVYRLDRASGADVVVTSFTGGADGALPAAALLNVNGILYGTTSAGGAAGAGTLFSLNPKTGARTTLYAFTGGQDGSGPTAALVDVGGVLYGTTNYGGSFNRGAIFGFAP